jgi:hypothetical protein
MAHFPRLGWDPTCRARYAVIIHVYGHVKLRRAYPIDVDVCVEPHMGRHCTENVDWTGRYEDKEHRAHVSLDGRFLHRSSLGLMDSVFTLRGLDSRNVNPLRNKRQTIKESITERGYT